MQNARTTSMAIALLVWAAFRSDAAATDPLDACNVVWTTPSTDSSGSMPLGNGDLALNLWVEADGDLRFYLSKSDARDHKDELLKLGRVRVHLDPSPFRRGAPFRQELRLRQGEIAIRAGHPDAPVHLRIWVDARRPVVQVELEGRRPFTVRTELEVWRTAERVLSAEEASGADQFASDEPPRVAADVVLDGPGDAIVWYHRNERSIWPATLEHQGLGSLIARFHDPLLARTFGGRLRGDGLLRTGATTLQSQQPGRRFTLSIVALTAQTASAGAWREQIEESAALVQAVPLAEARAKHAVWWDEFWDRSWIRVTSSGAPETAGGMGARRLERNQLPLRLGADSTGANRYQGDLARASVFKRALTAAEIRRLAEGLSVAASDLPDCVAEWDAGLGAGEVLPSRGPVPVPMRVVGAIETASTNEASAPGAIRFTGQGYLEAAHSAELDLADAVTLAAWVRPETLPGGGARIIDKTQAGTSNGYLLDTHPGNSLRLIVADGALGFDAKLPTNRWSHVAGVFDARTGEKKLYVNGQAVASGETQPPAAPDHEIVTRGYTLQRFLNACAGRGGLPIKFNGSLFTVDVAGKFDGDYRQWGGCYWFQNTRLPYWPMLASGDFDLLEPLYRMYREALPLARERTRIYHQHEGAFFPETMHFWGVYHNGGLGYGWNRADLPLGLTENRYIRYHWSSGLELLALMLDDYAFTQDQAFLRQTVLDHAEAVLEFYQRHYPRDDQGRLLVKPAQALETWWECENPTPEIAGLQVTLDGLLSLPHDWLGPTRLAAWQSLRAALPPIPRRQTDGQEVIAPAQSFAVRSNMENPELYAIFPFRAFGLGKPDLDLARRTFATRMVKGNRGWQQDETQAAYLGLTDEARRMLVDRLATKHPGSRFPAFWGPNFDWIPDQDHGANGLMTLQTMLLQCEGRRLLLLPAWPKDWDVEFRLHAPFETIVEGVYRHGRMERLKVTPASRAQDVVTGPF